MNNSISLFFGFCIAVCLFFTPSGVFAQGTGNGNAGGNGNGATPGTNGVTLPSQNNGQGFQNGQGHLNGNSNINLGDCSTEIDAFINGQLQTHFCVIERTSTTLEYYRMTTSPAILHHEIIAFDPNTCAAGPATVVQQTSFDLRCWTRNFFNDGCSNVLSIQQNCAR